MAGWAVGGRSVELRGQEVNEEVKAEMIEGEGNLKRRRDASRIDRGPSIVDHVWGKVAWR